MPEGFFQKSPSKIEKVQPGTEKKNNCPELDIKVLEQMLSDNEAFVNAEMLLRKYHLLRVQQVEEERFYNDVSRSIQKLIDSGSNACDYLVVKSELDYLQDKRTAAMLQRIPEIVDNQFQQGNIKSKKAIFTMGMSHLNKILQYLDENRIRIYSPLLAYNKGKDYIEDLNLKKENFAVFVILPQTLLDDPKILEMSGLDKIKF